MESFDSLVFRINRVPRARKSIGLYPTSAKFAFFRNNAGPDTCVFICFFLSFVCSFFGAGEKRVLNGCQWRDNANHTRL